MSLPLVRGHAEPGHLRPLAQGTSHVRHWSEDNGECELKTGQVKRLTRLESAASNASRPGEMPNDERLRKTVSDLTREKLVSREAASGVRAVSETVRGTVSGPNGQSP